MVPCKPFATKALVHNSKQNCVVITCITAIQTDAMDYNMTATAKSPKLTGISGSFRWGFCWWKRATCWELIDSYDGVGIMSLLECMNMNMGFIFKKTNHGLPLLIAIWNWINVSVLPGKNIPLTIIGFSEINVIFWLDRNYRIHA